MELKKHDMVQVITGNDRGAKGRVLSVDTTKNRVIIEGVNIRKRRLKPSQRNPQGGIVPQELAIHVSNVMLIDPKSGTPTRVKHKKIKDTKLNKERWVRIASKSGELIP